MNDMDNLQSGPRPFRRPWLPIVVATLALLLHAPSWSHPFVYDDVTAVRDHPLVRGDGGWFDVLRSPYWPADVSPDPLYRPLTIASFRLDHALFGGGAMGFHVINSVLHACVSVLIALLAKRLWDSRGAGWFAGLLFAAHPACVEAVVPIVGRSELLALLFIAWMVYVHLGRIQAGRGPSALYHLKLTLLYALACASKEHGLLAIVVIAAVDWRNRPPFGGANVDYREWGADPGFVALPRTDPCAVHVLHDEMVSVRHPRHAAAQHGRYAASPCRRRRCDHTPSHRLRIVRALVRADLLHQGTLPDLGCGWV